MDDRRTTPVYSPHPESDNSGPTNASASQQSLHSSRPVLQYRKPGWRLRTFQFESRIRGYPIQKMRCVSLAQMCVGLVCLGFSVAVIAVHAWGSQIGVGIWGGALFTMAGGIGIVAYLSLKLGFVWSTFLLSTAAFLVAFVLFVVSCVGIEQDLQSLHDLERGEAHGFLKIIGAKNIIEQHKLRVGFNGVLLFMAILELILSLAQALFNGRHFFVWDEGCTSESPYVYSNEGAGIEMDLPPTYQEAMEISIAMTQGSVPCTRTDHDHGDEDSKRRHIPGAADDGSQCRMTESPPIYSDSIEIQSNRERNARPQLDEPLRTCITVGSPADSLAQPNRYRSGAPRDPTERLPSNTEVSHDGPDSLPYSGLMIGQRYPRGSRMVEEPMYRRPPRPVPPSVDPIYASLHHYSTENSLKDGHRDGAPAPRMQFSEEPQNIDYPRPTAETRYQACTDWRTDEGDDRRPANSHSHSSAVAPRDRDVHCHDRLRPLRDSYSASVHGEVGYYPPAAGVNTDVESHI